MNIGMLWFDNDPDTPLSLKVQKAAEYYQKKYGRLPDTCLVHPAMLADAQLHVDRIIVQPLKTLRPNHLWLGINEKLPSGAD